jgi:predicted DNA-binding protein
MAKEEMKMVSIRMPAELAELLQNEAKKNTRSLAGEIINRLKKTLESDRPEPK